MIALAAVLLPLAQAVASSPVVDAAADAVAVRSADPPWAARRDIAFVRSTTTSSPATAVAQDAAGLLWLATGHGLLRWDGHRVHDFEADPERPGALPDNDVNTVISDAAGRIWIGMNSGGLVRHDPQADAFVSPLASGQGLSSGSVLALCEDGTGSLWVGTASGLDWLDVRKGIVLAHERGAGRQGLPQRTVYALARDSSGALWVGTDEGLFVRAAAGGPFERVALPTPEGDASFVTTLMLDGERRLWVGTRTSGVFVVEAGRRVGVALQALLPARAPRLATAKVTSLMDTGRGEAWIGTSGEGIWRIDTVHWQARQLRHDSRRNESLADDEIYSLFRDRNGRAWVSTEGQLHQHDLRQQTFNNWFGGDADPDGRGIGHFNVLSLLARPDGTVWLGVGDRGIDIVHPRHGRIGRVPVDSRATQTSLPAARVAAMVSMPGVVFVGTERGLYRVNEDGSRPRRLTIPGRSPNAPVWALCLEGARLWVAGNDGLWAVLPQPDGRLRVVAREDGRSLGEPRIVGMLNDGPDRLWIATKTGVRLLDTATMTAQALPGGLPRGEISDLLIDASGRLWIASFGEGLRVYDRRRPDVPIRRITQTEGLPHNVVDAVVADHHGDIWASTDAGIARIDQRSFEVRAFRGADGVGIPSYWVTARTVTADGAIVFGGTGGITIVDPKQLPLAHRPAPVVVTELRAGDEKPRSGSPTVPAAQPVVLGHESRNVLVEFALLDYGPPARKRYQHRIAGIDKDWTDTEPSRRVAAYTNLPPGDHVLELRGKGADGAWSDVTRVPLHVPAAWHETGAFRASLALAGLLLIAGLVQARTAVLRRRQRVLERMVAERTAALQTRTHQLQRRTEELQQSERRLEEMAYRDGLTGLANRRMFTEQLRRMVAQAQRTGQPLYLLLIDLDHFKQINDTLGHDAGDAVLRAVAQRLEAAVRSTDLPARLGGDEFAVLLPENATPDAVRVLCERIIQSLAAPPPAGTPPLPGASVGAATLRPSELDPDRLTKAADVALYEAKNAGRNRWRLRAEGVGEPVMP